MRNAPAVARVFAVDGGWSGIACTPEGVCAGIIVCGTQRSAAESLAGCAMKVLDLPADAVEALATRGELDLGGGAPARALCDRAAAQLARFVSGDAVAFEVPIDLSGHTPFRQRVLREVAKLGWAETASYGEIATRIGRPNAARAVGQTMATNILAPFVPCHRVLGGGGRLHGFGGGLPMKAAMLRAEGVRVTSDDQALEKEGKTAP